MPAAQKTSPSKPVADSPVRSPLVATGSQPLVVQSGDVSTVIRPHVVAKIAGLAIREVSGVHALVPTGTGQAITNLARSISGTDMRDLGVSVEVGQVEAAVDARIITDYGRSIPEIAEGINANVSRRIQEMTGLVVKEITVEVVDLWFDDDAAPDDPPSRRVQ